MGFRRCTFGAFFGVDVSERVTTAREYRMRSLLTVDIVFGLGGREIVTALLIEYGNWSISLGQGSSSNGFDFADQQGEGLFETASTMVRRE